MVTSIFLQGLCGYIWVNILTSSTQRGKTGGNTRGKGYWKINNSVLNEENYKVGINKLFVDLLEEYGQDVPKPLLWEFLKLKIKEFTISYCTSRSRSVKQNIKDLEEQIDELDRSHDNLTSDQYDKKKKLVLSRVHEYSNASQLHCQNEYRFPDSINRQ